LFDSAVVSKKINFLGSFNTGNCILINAVNKPENRYLLLEYSCENKQYCYKIHIKEMPCNTGFGRILLAVCPVTGSLCKKLYLFNNYFLSRYAIAEGRYRQQYIQKSHLPEYRMMRDLQKSGMIINRKDRPYYRPIYAGIETKTGKRTRISEQIIKMHDHAY
jgi:hypothetical protein